jgi:hypothetical protein
MLHRSNKGAAMTYIDIAAIERRARALRAEEMQRLQGIFAERMRLYARLLGRSLLSLLGSVGKTLRPVFSWNPQRRRIC